ncbi:hypothetical protein B0H13DRAFT_1917405 [Mycena leptocephala]|nr:hypothetical protein B0H13DRAFT_1917405 [Mycena leptocephala]
MPRISSKENRAPHTSSSSPTKRRPSVVGLETRGVGGGRNDLALKVFLENEDSRGDAFPIPETHRRTRKESAREVAAEERRAAYVAQGVRVGNEFHPRPVLGRASKTLNSRYIKAATRVRTLRKYVAYIDNQVEREENCFGLKWKLVAVRLSSPFYSYGDIPLCCTFLRGSWTTGHAERIQEDLPGHWAQVNVWGVRFMDECRRTVQDCFCGYREGVQELARAGICLVCRLRPGGAQSSPRPTPDGSAPSAPPSPPPPSPTAIFTAVFTRRTPFRSLSSPADSPSLGFATIFVHSLAVCRIGSLASPPARFPIPHQGVPRRATPYSPTTGKVGRARPTWLVHPIRARCYTRQDGVCGPSNGQGVVFGSYEQARGYTTSFSRKGAMRHLQQALHLPTACRFWKDSQWRGALQRLLAGELDPRGVRRCHRRLIDTWRDTLGTDGGESDGWEDGVESDDSWSSESSEVLTEVER